MTETVSIQVGGMTCAACQVHVQKALEQTPGVTRAGVSLMAGEATVVFDPQQVAPAALVEAIRETGYEADLPEPGSDALAHQEADVSPGQAMAPGRTRTDAPRNGFDCLRRRRIAPATSVGASAPA